ncbi:MAG: DUF938 domain-containing protein [Xanthomonadales bacterium]|nr:DUF938 domain-containing protein [Xanthomonadales bacterium]
MKPFSEAAARNGEAILAELQVLLGTAETVLEIGSGTGQHAVLFAHHLPGLTWQPSDVAENLPGIRAWASESELPNLADPICLDLAAPEWPEATFDAVFSANVMQVIGSERAEELVAGAARRIRSDGLLVLYGPFNEGGQFTSPGNRALDQWARRSFHGGGLKDLEWVTGVATAAGLQPEPPRIMPANNRLLVFRKRWRGNTAVSA